MSRNYCSYSFLMVSVLLLNVSHQAWATHLLGGEIVAESVTCHSHTYKIKIILYQDSGSDVEFGNGELSFGHGALIHVDPHTDFTLTFIEKDSLYKVVHYEIEHTFPGPGAYLISFREFNRNADIANIRNSVNTPFYTETQLVVDPLIGCNNTPVLQEDSLTFVAYAHSLYIQPLQAVDPDGDSLSFAFVTPKQDIDIAVERYYTPEKFDIRFIENATASDGVSLPTFSANQQQLVWDAPNVGGDFTYALQITEWRQIEGQWTKIGYMTRDMSILVLDTIHHTQAIDYITAIEEKEDDHSFLLSPNPTEGLLTLTIQEDFWQGGTVSVYNILGQLIAKGNLVYRIIHFDLSDQSEGIYLLHIRHGLHQKTLRVIKR